MQRLLRVTALVVFALCATPRAVQAEERLPATLAEANVCLRQLQQVEGSAVGDGATPGRFFLFSQVFLRLGHEADFVALVADENPIVRAMGYVCLAQVSPDKVVPILKSRLGGRDTFTCFPGGCVGFPITEGEFVRSVLSDRHYLGCRLPRKDGSRAVDAEEFRQEPLLGPDDLLVLDLTILATDPWRHLHYWAGERVGAHLKPEPGEAKQAFLGRGDLDRLAAKANLAMLVKGVGRINPTPRGRQILISYAEDVKAEARVRLAAASALTRDADPAAGEALRRLKPDLDRMAGDKATARMLDTWAAAGQLAEIMRGLLRDRGSASSAGVAMRDMSPADKQAADDRRGAALARWVRKTLENRHPTAPFEVEHYYLESLRWMNVNDDDPPPLEGSTLERHWARALAALAARLPEFADEWNTYSDRACALADMIRDWDVRACQGAYADAPQFDEDRGLLKRHLGAEAYERMVGEVNAHLPAAK